MNTPICDFIEKYNDNRLIRLHMPGHKGKFDNFSPFDITEVEGADSLFLASGIIRESEENASEIFGSGQTFYSAEGSSLCIRTMVYLVKTLAKTRGENATIMATRNAHQSFISALALCDVDVEWIYGENLLSCELSAKMLDEKLSQMPTLPTAVYVTSPDYLGHILPIGEIAKVCQKFGVLLLVDNAHGAYLKFLSEGLHPLDLGADMCCDSAHKTLPCLTGGAYLHIKKGCNLFDRESVKSAMKMFASTSPSYLILRSLDYFNKWIYDNSEAFFSCAKMVETLKNRLIGAHFTLFGEEPLKITIKCKPFGYTGKEIGNYLLKNNISYEFCDDDFLVLMFSPSISENDFVVTEKALLSLKRKEPILLEPPKLIPPQKVLSVRNAMFAPRELVETSSAEGKILSDCMIGCPPAVPIAIAGELINSNVIELLRYYKIKHLYIVK